MILALTEVKKSYRQGSNTIEVLTGVNLEIAQGTSNAIVGKSGEGKSTLLSLIAGLDKPDSGKVEVGGKDIALLPEKELTRYRAQTMSLVFQQYHLMSTLTALENVMLPLEILKKTNAKEKAVELLEKVELGHRKHHLPNELSGGESQRVAIARALASDPQLLLADEPSGNLDHFTGRKVMDLIFNLVADYKTTLVLVTHDEDLASKCQNSYRLNEGKLDARD